MMGQEVAGDKVGSCMGDNRVRFDGKRWFASLGSEHRTESLGGKVGRALASFTRGTGPTTKPGTRRSRAILATSKSAVRFRGKEGSNPREKIRLQGKKL